MASTIIRTGCVLEPPDTHNTTSGLTLIRYCIMSRLTLADGKTPDERLREYVDHPERHWKELAPDPRMVGAWHRGEIDWETFAQAYVKRLRTPPWNLEVPKLLDMAARQPLILLCIEPGPHRCHRRLLAEHCANTRPGIELDIR